jgi:hypothetical protein
MERPRLCSQNGSMSDYTTRPPKCGPQTVASLQETRITARVHVDEAGGTRTVYRANGREFKSRSALLTALSERPQGQPRSQNTESATAEDRHV